MCSQVPFKPSYPHVTGIGVVSSVHRGWEDVFDTTLMDQLYVRLKCVSSTQLLYQLYVRLKYVFQGLSQDFETGCLKLAVVKCLGVQIL